MNLRRKIILALDVDSEKKARYFVDRLYPEIKIFKVGLQLFTLCGPDIIKYINKKGAEVFLDLKIFDIPNTAANAVRSAVRQKVKMLTLHIAGAEEMLKAAKDAAEDEAGRLKLKRPLLIGVTLLTSRKASPSAVLRLGKIGLSCGLDGVVCSAREARTLRRNLGKKFLIVTPGIRIDKSAGDDQKRTATASEAISVGSDFLVIGRPILKARDPLAMVRGLLVK